MLDSYRDLLFVLVTSPLLYIVLLRRPSDVVHAADHGRDDARRVRGTIIAVAAFVVVVILANLVFAVLKERRDILSATRQSAENLVQVIEEQTAASIHGIEVAFTVSLT